MKVRIASLVIVLCVLVSTTARVYAGEPGDRAAAADVQGTQGIQDGWALDDQGKVLFTAADGNLMAQTGAGWVRIHFRLGAFTDWTETSSFGYSALSRYDMVVANAHASRLKILGLLSNESWHGFPTDWRANSAEAAGGTGNNTYLEDFAQRAAVVLAVHFAGRVDRWQVWNEPNVDATYLHPSNFASLLGNVYTRTKLAGVRTAIFISGGLSSVQDPRGQITGSSSGADYLRDTYARGLDRAGWAAIRTSYGSYPLDGVGQHIYVDGFRMTTGRSVTRTLQIVRDTYVAAEGGATAKKTFITEVGWGSNNVGEKVQVSNLQMAYTRFKAAGYVETAFWFSLRDSQAAGLYFGLLRPDLSRKPSWEAYRAYAGY